MPTRLPAVLCLSLVLVSCDKKEQTTQTQEETAEKTNTHRATKSSRAGGLKEQKQAHDQRRAALMEAGKLPPGEERDNAIAQWIWDSFELDPELAWEGFQLLTPGSPEKNRLLEHYAMRLAEQDVGQAKTWASSLESEEEKSLAYGKIALVISDKDPAAAASLLSDAGIAGRDFDVAVVEVVQQWVGTDPRKAADWVVRFDEGEARTAAVKAVTAGWVSVDPEASVSWISSLRNNAIREEAVTGYAEATMGQPPILREAALEKATPEIRARIEQLETRMREAEEEAEPEN